VFLPDAVKVPSVVLADRRPAMLQIKVRAWCLRSFEEMTYVPKRFL
jgi:hypothetical protein